MIQSNINRLTSVYKRICQSRGADISIEDLEILSPLLNLRRGAIIDLYEYLEKPTFCKIIRLVIELSRGGVEKDIIRANQLASEIFAEIPTSIRYSAFRNSFMKQNYVKCQDKYDDKERIECMKQVNKKRYEILEQLIEALALGENYFNLYGQGKVQLYSEATPNPFVKNYEDEKLLFRPYALLVENNAITKSEANVALPRILDYIGDILVAGLKDPSKDKLLEVQYLENAEALISKFPVNLEGLSEGRYILIYREAMEYGYRKLAENLTLGFLKSAPQMSDSEIDEFLDSAFEDRFFSVIFFLMHDYGLGDSYVLRRAFEGGHLGLVQELLDDSRVDPSDGDNYALYEAVNEGHDDIVEQLLDDPRVTISDANQEEFLLNAASKPNSEIFETLLYSSKFTPSEDTFYKIIRAPQSREYSKAQKETIKYASELQDLLLFEETFLDDILTDTLEEGKRKTNLDKLYFLVENGARIRADYIHEKIKDENWDLNTDEFLLFYFLDIKKDFKDLKSWKDQNEAALSFMENYPLLFLSAELLEYPDSDGSNERSKLATENFFIDNYLYWFQDLLTKNADNEEFMAEVLKNRKNLIYTGDINSLEYKGPLNKNLRDEFVKIIQKKKLESSAFEYLLKLIIKERFYLAGLLKVSQTSQSVEKILLNNMMEKHRKFCQLKIIRLSDYERRDMIAQLLKKNVSLFKKDEYANLLTDFGFTCKLLAISMVCADLRKNFSLAGINNMYSELFDTDADFESKEEMCNSLENKLFRAEIEKETLKRKKRTPEGTRKRQRVK